MYGLIISLTVIICFVNKICCIGNDFRWMLNKHCRCSCDGESVHCNNKPRAMKCLDICTKQCKRGINTINMKDGSCIDEANCTCFRSEIWKPVCTHNKVTLENRGFGSLENLFCYNICEKNDKTRYEFIKDGWCDETLLKQVTINEPFLKVSIKEHPLKNSTDLSKISSLLKNQTKERLEKQRADWWKGE